MRKPTEEMRRRGPELYTTGEEWALEDQVHDLSFFRKYFSLDPISVLFTHVLGLVEFQFVHWGVQRVSPGHTVQSTYALT